MRYFIAIITVLLFVSCNQKKQSDSKATKSFYEEKGLEYALSTKTVLGKNLIEKIQKEGTITALEFCNIKAFPLTDSVSVSHNVKIKRVTDKPRNPLNKATKKELEYINVFKNNIINNKELTPLVVESSEIVNVYYPIKTNGMCLQCHGAPKAQVSEKTFSKIKELYPNDRAIGYDINEVRGIWSISFNK